MLFYRAVAHRGPQGEKMSGFPYLFSLVEHDFLGLVQEGDHLWLVLKEIKRDLKD